MVGGKVVLRTMEEQDRELVMNLIRDPEIVKVTGRYPDPASFDHQMNWFCSLPDSAREVRRVIADKDRPESGLGIIILSDMDLDNRGAELYIKMARDFRGKGYGQDAVNLLVEYAFRELELSCVCSNILEYNTVSRKLFENCGFKLENIRKTRGFKENTCRNVCFYSIRNGG